MVLWLAQPCRLGTRSMRRPKDHKPIENPNESPASLSDADIATVRIDRRSFLSRAAVVGSVAAGAAMSTGCPGGTDGTDSDSESQ